MPGKGHGSEGKVCLTAVGVGGWPWGRPCEDWDEGDKGRRLGMSLPSTVTFNAETEKPPLGRRLGVLHLT